MITWATTVAPQTESFFYRSLSEVRPANPGVGASITQVVTGAATERSIWSKTIASTVGQGVFGGSGNSQTVLGTTNSTSWQTRSDGLLINPSVTVRSVINQTSTETTRQYTYRPTATSTSAVITIGSTVFPEFIAFGSVFPASTVFGNFISAIQTYTSTFFSNIITSSETCFSTTTVTQETIATPIFATVLLAEKNEVIWVANTTAATALSGITAASSVATSTTRTTIMPWTQTVTAVQANSTETTEVNLSEILATFSYSKTDQTNFTETVIENYQSLPHRTISTESTSLYLSSTNLSATIAQAQTITVTKSQGTETLYVRSSTTARAFANGSSFISSGTTTGTIERQNTVPTAESSTYSSTNEVVAYIIPATWANTSEWEQYTWTASYQYTTSNSATVFAKKSQNIATLSALASTSYEARSGVVDLDGNVFLGYSINSTLGSGFGASRVSRHASSAFPSSGEFVTLYPESGEPTNNSASFSKLSASLSFPGSTSTTTASAQLEAFGTALMVQSEPGAWRSAIDPRGFGKSETIFMTIPRGVYSANGATFSTSGQTTSVASSDSVSSAVPLSVSFIVPATGLANADKIWWTVSRNSHTSFDALTAAQAYSAL